MESVLAELSDSPIFEEIGDRIGLGWRGFSPAFWSQPLFCRWSANEWAVVLGWLVSIGCVASRGLKSFLSMGLKPLGNY